MLTDDEGRSLVRLARHTLESRLGAPESAPEPVVRLAPASVGGVFATLKCEGDLRGCIGYVLSSVDLVELTKRAVVGAAENDPRFPSVTAAELPQVRINITVLAPPEPIEELSEIQIGRDGLVVERAGVRGLLLPQVAAERGWDRERFVRETCIKAGLPEQSWQEADTLVLRFAAIQFEED